MVMIIKSICGVAAFSSALLAGAARVDDEQAQQPLPQSTIAVANAEVVAGVAAAAVNSGVVLSSSLKKEHAMAVEAQAEILQTQMAGQAKTLAAKAKEAEEKKVKANAAFENAKHGVDFASQKEAAAIEANTAAEAAQAAAFEAKDKQQHVYGGVVGHFKRIEESAKKATEAKLAAIAKSKEADEKLAQLQDEMHLKVKEATKDREIAKSAEAAYKAAKIKTDDLSTLAKRVSLNKIITENIAIEASAAAKEVGAEEKKLSTKLDTLTPQKASAVEAANIAMAKAQTTEKVSTESTGLAFTSLRKKVASDEQKNEDAEISHMVNDAAGTAAAPAQQKVKAQEASAEEIEEARQIVEKADQQAQQQQQQQPQQQAAAQQQQAVQETAAEQ